MTKPKLSLMKSRYRWLVFLIITIGFVILSYKGLQWLQGPDVGASAFIGPEGGSVHDTLGSAVELPAGSISKEMEIYLTTYPDQTYLKTEQRSLYHGWLGAAEFGPDGTVFDKPVMVTIPSPVSLTPGEQMLLYEWNEEEHSWEETDFVATVNADGQSYSAEVTHFTTLTGSVRQGPQGAFHALSSIDKDDYAHEIDLGVWANIFEMQSFRNVGMKRANEDCCWQLVGLRFKYYVKIDDYTFSDELSKGDTSDYDWNELTRKAWSDNYAVRVASVEVYWKSVQPDVEYDLPDPNVYIGDVCLSDETELTITLNCGKQTFIFPYQLAGAKVELSVDGEGEVEPETVKTDAHGKAQATFRGTEKGKPTINAEVITCQQEPEQHREEGEVGQVCAQEKENWTVVGNLTFSHEGEGIPWTYNDIVAYKIEFEVDNETGEITSSGGQGGHRLSIKPTRDNCSVQGLNAPTFTMDIVDGIVTDEAISLEIVPRSLPLSFSVHCEYENMDPIDVPVPAYSNLEASIMGKVLDLEIPLNCDGGHIDGSGAEGFGDGSPIDYTFDVLVAGDYSCDE